jgi:hypothetical protein
MVGKIFLFHSFFILKSKVVKVQSYLPLDITTNLYVSNSNNISKNSRGGNLSPAPAPLSIEVDRHNGP